MRGLLDVNVVIALLDPDHVFHDTAHGWWRSHRTDGWASCPITENGVVRIMSNPAYSPDRKLETGELIAILGQFISNSDHEFWSDDRSLLDPGFVNASLLVGARQVTDVYLLGACRT